MPISKLAEEDFFTRGMKPDPTQIHFAGITHRATIDHFTSAAIAYIY